MMSLSLSLSLEKLWCDGHWNEFVKLKVISLLRQTRKMSGWGRDRGHTQALSLGIALG